MSCMDARREVLKARAAAPLARPRVAWLGVVAAGVEDLADRPVELDLLDLEQEATGRRQVDAAGDDLARLHWVGRVVARPRAPKRSISRRSAGKSFSCFAA